jgi:hypothetical protein
MAGPGWRVLTTRPSRFEAHPPAARAASIIIIPGTREIFIKGL